MPNQNSQPSTPQTEDNPKENLSQKGEQLSGMIRQYAWLKPIIGIVGIFLLIKYTPVIDLLWIFLQIVLLPLLFLYFLGFVSEAVWEDTRSFMMRLKEAVKISMKERNEVLDNA